MTETANQQAIARVPMHPPSVTPLAVGSRGIQVQSFEDLWRVADAAHKSGLFRERHFESAAQVFICLEMALELGLPMMAALNKISVINGRPCLESALQLALCEERGVLTDHSITIEGDGDDMVALFDFTRRGKQPKQVCYSVKDAKVAGLWGAVNVAEHRRKYSPWVKHPRTMLQWRAVAAAMRLYFSDVTLGLLSAEEAADIDHPDPTAMGLDREAFPPPAETTRGDQVLAKLKSKQADRDVIEAPLPETPISDPLTEPPPPMPDYEEEVEQAVDEDPDLGETPELLADPVQTDACVAQAEQPDTVVLDRLDQLATYVRGLLALSCDQDTARILVMDWMGSKKLDVQVFEDEARWKKSFEASRKVQWAKRLEAYKEDLLQTEGRVDS